jgi:hypothetical protein
MSWREVTKDDVGKMVEVRDKESHYWKVRELEHILSRPDGLGQRYLVWGEDKQYPLQYRYARIRTSPLPDGWLPDDWRVLGDDEICGSCDLIVYKQAVFNAFDGRAESPYMFGVDNGYVGRNVKWAANICDHHLCVIRPRWRRATKDDSGKDALSVHYTKPFTLASILEPDQYGIDCTLRHECGYRFDRLKDLKVENEGWHVTH